MLPRKWNTWQPVTKVTYIAQLTTAAAFFATTGFGYLSWREAAGAREDQKIFFISEKRPVLKVSGDDAMITRDKKFVYKIIILNEGLSAAEQITMVVTDLEGKPKTIFPIMGLSEKFKCSSKSLDKGDYLSCAIDIDRIHSTETGSQSLKLKFYTDYSKIDKSYQFIYTIQVNYEGIFGDKHNLTFWVEQS